MTSYLPSYQNPISKRITDFLSHYIDLEEDNEDPDPHHHQPDDAVDPTTTTNRAVKKNQKSLSVGIWSGHLNLHHVRLRNDTMNQLLDQYLVHVPKNNNTSNNNHLRYQLVSGTIGSLQIDIPWSQLFTTTKGAKQAKQRGPSVTLQNVVLVVTLDRPDDRDRENGDDQNDDHHPDDQDDPEPRPPVHSRSHKQRLIQEIERRWYSSKSSSPTNAPLESLGEVLRQLESSSSSRHSNHRARHKSVETTTTTTVNAATLQKNEYWLSSYLQKLTKDLLYTLFVNLSVQLDQLHLVLVVPQYRHDDDRHAHYLEWGCRIPFIQMNNGDIQMSDPILPSNTTTTTTTTDPIEKFISIKGLGGYIRSSGGGGPPFWQRPWIHPEVPTKDYILRPLDIDFQGTFWIPTITTDQPDRKKRDRPSVNVATIPTSSSSTTTTTHSESSTGPRKRRGKREKDAHQRPTTADTTKQETMVPEHDDHSKLSSSIPNRSHPTSRRSSRPDLHRAQTTVGSTPRSSWYRKPRNSGMPRPTPYTTHQWLRRTSTTTQLLGGTNSSFVEASDVVLPLAQPNDLGAYYLSQKRSSGWENPNHEDGSSGSATGMTSTNTTAPNCGASYTELNGTLSIGAIHAVCTSTHYQLLNDWYATTMKLRNGRPFVSIRTVLRQRWQGMLLEDHSVSTSKIGTDPITLDATSNPTPPLSYNPQIRLWWRYVYNVIIQELRQRKQTRVRFQKMFLCFDWSKQSRYRAEYVKMFIQCRLQSTTTNKASSTTMDRPAPVGIRSVTFESTPPSNSVEERLLVIEDELSVEQILLYRCVARKVHANGFLEMPLSILEVNANVKTVVDNIDASIHSTKKSNAKKVPSESRCDSTNFVSTISTECETSRVRCYSTIGGIIPEHPPEIQKQPQPNALTVADEGSKYGMRSDASRTLKTNRTTTSHTDRSGVASTAMDHISNATKKFKMMYTFRVNVQKVELLIIEEESVGHLSRDNGDCTDDDSTTCSNDNISLLTDDDVRSSHIDQTGELNLDGVAETETIDPISSSTDFLLFDTPKRVLLQFEMTHMDCSLLGDSSNSRCLNFRIRQVTAVGADNLPLLLIGQDNMPPLGEVLISSGSGVVSTNQARRSSTLTNDAMVLSLAINSNHNFLQCDAPTIRVFVEVAALKKLLTFHHGNTATIPKPMLDRQPREQVRLYILQQHKIEFPDLNCSVRIQGCDISLLHEATRGSTGTVEHSMTETISQMILLNSAVVLRCNMIEMYSGTAVTELCDLMDEWRGGDSNAPELVGSQLSNVTRQLGMLDLPSLMTDRPSILSFPSVVAINGIDIVLSPASSAPLSLFQDSVSVEVLYTLNSESLLDLNEAKQMIVAEVSPVHVIVSKDIVLGLAKSNIVDQYNQFLTLSAAKMLDNDALPPRLEVLSGFLRCMLRLSIRALRLSILSGASNGDGSTLSTNKLVLEGIMKDFLHVVSVYDINFPHEAAVDTAMNICISRLVGLGIPTDDAWEAANLAVLHFLDEVEGQDPQESLHIIDLWGYDQTSCTSAIEKAAFATSSLLLDLLENVQSQGNGNSYIELPGGLMFKSESLFYDHHSKIVLPSLLVGNTDGLRFVHIAPHETSTDASKCTSDNVLSDKSSQCGEDSAAQNVIPNGAMVHLFSQDKGFLFGKGGLPLSSLGSDTIADAPADNRARELLLDFSVGDIELTFSSAAFIDAIGSIQLLIKPLLNLFDKTPTEEGKRVDRQSTIGDTLIFMKASSLSSLFLSDDLHPFIRFSACDFVVVSKQVDASSPGKNTQKWSNHIVSQSLRLVNLTREGQLFPEVVVPLPNSTSHCFSVSIDPVSGTNIDAKLLRVCVLRQFINEATQYFTTPQYGLGRLLDHFSIGKTNRNTKTEYVKEPTVTLQDISIILPRSCYSYDMVCVEVTKVLLTFSRQTKSFRMPSRTAPLDLSDDQIYSDLVDDSAPFVSRKTICMSGFKIFSSSAEKMPSNVHFHDELSFRSKFELNGRAESSKRVFISVDKSTNTGIDDNTNLPIGEKANRCWKELTTSMTSIAIVVDSMPNLRLLITDAYTDLPSTGLHLSVTLSQLALLQSIWFSNMQELPQLFPYSTATLKQGSGPQEVLQTIPDYGSEDFRSFLSSSKCISSEVALILKELSLNCIFDSEACNVDQHTAIGSSCVYFGEAAVHITNDRYGIVRIGVGCKSVSLVDESTVSRVVLSAAVSNSDDAWADLAFGLDQTDAQLSTLLSQSLQLSMFLTPSWNVYTLGLISPNITMSDLSPIFKLLGFLSAYASNATLGNPSFDISDRVRKFKNDLYMNAYGRSRLDSGAHVSAPSLDFRLWINHPLLSIPLDLSGNGGPCLRVEGEGGLRYKFMKVNDVTSQECIADCLNFTIDSFLVIPNDKVRYRNPARKLVENFCFGFRLDSNSSTHHNDVCIKIPFIENATSDTFSSRISLSPTILPQPKICSPFRNVTRSTGPTVCEMTCIVDVLPMLTMALLKLFSSGDDIADSNGHNTPFEFADESAGSSAETRIETFSMVAAVTDVRIFVLDPTLGPHLPIAVLSISSTSLSVSQFAGTSLGSESLPPSLQLQDLQISVSSIIWADYFKLGMTRSWEPLLEPYRFQCDFETSCTRGSGLTFNSDSFLHVNVSSALLTILDEVVDDLYRVMQRYFDSNQPCISNVDGWKEDKVSDNHIVDSFAGNDVMHEFGAAVQDEDRVAFSFRNMTGQKIRIIRPSAASLNVLYLRHTEAKELKFPPSISIVKNLHMTEVNFPGLPNDLFHHHADLKQHRVDVQLPGFKWLEGIIVDTFGRKFAKILPLSKVVQTKIDNDWRIANILYLLVEVGLRNGGRQVTVRSIISVINKTNHGVGVLLHPDPLFTPDELEPSETDLKRETHSKKATQVEADYFVKPGEWFQIPTLLLENSLRQSGTNLGRMWIKPFIHESVHGMPVSNSPIFSEIARDADVGFSSRPVPFTRLVNESANMFELTRYRDIPSDSGRTKLQLSCPVTNRTGERIAPICYAVEIDRSPIVRDHVAVSQPLRPRHLPVAYSIIIHPPIVITNHLPCEGRFELMHAVHRAVLWSGDLTPGQEVSIHSVGLDVPLFLFLNVGFAKTPVGEGALVHHGPDPPPNIRDNLVSLKSISKAGKAVTKRLGKTLNTIGESSDTRGLKRIFNAQNLRKSSPNKPSNPVRNEMKIRTDAEKDDEVDGKTYKIDNFHYFADDVAQHTTIVDGVGQRLTLSIENIRGGGGQRRVTVFCRFWIVNTTEHCLRYRQESSKLFVSGTVLSPDKDGSLPLLGARSQLKYENHTDNVGSAYNERVSRRVYAGTPGALANFPGRCDKPGEDVAALLDSNIPIEEVAKWSFMFSFQDDHANVGNHKMCVQLWDGTGSTRYVSDWSRGFGVDSVGVAQTISLHCKDGRALELNVVVTVGPGALSNYTSIIRILPRYAIVNNLPYPVRIWQDNSTFGSKPGDELTSKKASKWRSNESAEDRAKINQYELLWGRPVTLNERHKSPTIGGTAARRSALYIATVYPSEILPFCLPDSRGERQLRIDPGSPWDLSGSISTSKPGDFTLSMKQAFDLTSISHETSRDSPHYEVRLPPHGAIAFDGDLGIWFESDYGTNTGLIVKAIRQNSYSFNETEIHVGDELLYLNGIQLIGLAFDEAINTLKHHLLTLSSKRRDGPNFGTPVKQGRHRSQKFQKNLDQPLPTTTMPSMVLTFRTVEERIRRVMVKTSSVDSAKRQSLHRVDLGERSKMAKIRDVDETDSFVHAELKNFPRSHVGLFLVLREEIAAPYELINESVAYNIFYRQRDCSHLKWECLKPGKSKLYSWDEPLKPKKLVIRVDAQNLFALGQSFGNTQTFDRSAEVNARNPLRSEDDVHFPKSILIPLDEVGYHEILSIHDTTMKNEMLDVPLGCLQFDVDVRRNARVLVVRDVTSDGGQRQMIQWRDALNENLKFEEKRRNDLQTFSRSLSESNTTTTIEDDHKHVLEDCNIQDFFVHDDVAISERHQILIEILEATGISSDSINSSCNPYCDVRLKHGHNRHRLFGKRDCRKTYYIRDTLTPVWNKQAFVFQVPPEAAGATRGYKIVVRVRNYSSLRFHQIIGYARIDLHSVRDQNSHLGWFPLVDRNGRSELNTTGSNLGRGSIRVRVQWIYQMPALVEYFRLLSESRIVLYQEFIDVVTKQSERLHESEIGNRAGLDGIQTVRIEDQISLPKNKRKENIDNLRRQKVKESMIKKSTGPVSHLVLEDSVSSGSQDHFTELPVMLRHPKHEGGFTKTAVSLHNVVHSLEKQISQKRLNRHNTAKHPFSGMLKTTDGIIPISLIRSWNIIQALLNDEEITVKFDGSNIEVSPRSSLSITDAASTCTMSEVANGISLKLRAPDEAPLSMKIRVNEYIDDWVRSRTNFERIANISMKTILHSGGWLSLRPITALNLPDMFTGMAVKIQYGSETYISDTADVRSLDPSWYNTNRRDLESNDWELVSANDIHIHIAPQLTSGTIRLSVIGEKKHKRPSSKTEIGVVHLPVGATITCLLDCEESRFELLRWFPLSPFTARTEGDGGLNVRPPDTEKESDSDFNEYFAPCIQLALFWSPDIGNAIVDQKDNNPRIIGEGIQRRNQEVVDRYKSSMEQNATFVKSYFNANVGWISAALIDSQRACELLSFNIKDVDLRYLVTTAKTRMGLTVGWLQIDYQDNDDREPVVLSPTPTGVLSPVIQTLVVKDNLRSEDDTLSFDFIDISIAELDFTVEERLVIDSMQFLSTLFARQRAKLQTNMKEASPGHRMEAENDISSASSFAYILMSTTADKKIDKAEKIYIKELDIGVIKVNISYLKGRMRDTAADNPLGKVLHVAGDQLFQRFFYNDDNLDPYLAWSQSTFDDDMQARNEDIVGPLNFQRFVERVFPNISDATLRLPGKSVKHQFETASDVVENIFKFYSSEALKQFYKIVGALDIVGNPAMLVTSFASGIRDFVMTPSSALINSPTDPSRLGIGVAQGTLSFLSHGASGLSGFASKAAAAAGQAVAAVSLDDEFRDWHNDNVVVPATNLNREWKRRGVQNISYILTKPIGDIIFGLAGGISGIVILPMKGFQTSGGTGLILGTVAGVIGIAAKPVVGILDAITHISASIHDVAKSVNVLDRRLLPVLKLRLPYTFGFMSVLAPFNQTEARATLILKRCPIREGYKSTTGMSENIINVEVLPSMGTEVFVIVTTLRVLLVRVKSEASGASTTTTCLEIYFSDDDALYSSKVDDYGHSSIALVVYKRTRDKNERSASKRTGILFALSPQVAWKTVTSRLGGIASPDQDPPNPAETAMMNHYDDDATGTDDEGTLIDKFTILADYQYQRELTRLHNVISCIVGNYDSLIYDRSLSVGRQRRSDGMTSFGMYFFERKIITEIEPDSERRTDALELLPWVGCQTFDDLKYCTVEEQKESMIMLREGNSLANELEAAKRDGGPGWFVSALATSTYEACTSGAHRSAIARTSERNEPGATLYHVDDFKSSMMLYNPGVSSKILNATNTTPQSETAGERYLENLQSSTNTSTSIYQDARQSDRTLFKSSTGSHQSFHSTNTSPTGEGTSTVSQSMRNSLWMDAQQYETKAVPTMDPSSLFSNTKPVASVKDNELEGKEYVQTTNVDSNRRLDRMEQLMERLLMFTADQTVLRNPPAIHPTANSNHEGQPPDMSSQQQLLWNEIALLRSMIMQQGPQPHGPHPTLFEQQQQQQHSLTIHRSDSDDNNVEPAAAWNDSAGDVPVAPLLRNDNDGTEVEHEPEWSVEQVD